MKKEISKIVAISIIVALNYAGLSAVGTTLASFGDTETSEGNILTAGVLDISASPDSFLHEITDHVVEIPITIDHALTTVSGKYKMTIEEKGESDSVLCSDLTGELRVPFGDVLYSGSLLDLNSATTTMSVALGESYSLRIGTSSPLTKELNGKTCKFEIHVVVWQEGVENPTDGGFADMEIISGEITSWAFGNGIVLNEFLPRPFGVDYGFDFGDDNSDMPKGEWVELYNNGSTAYDISGWYIKDGASNKIPVGASHLLSPATTIIPAHGFVVVYMNNAILNNGGDTITLYNSSDTPIDSYTYDSHSEFCDLEATPGEINDEAGSGGTTGCGGVPKNKSYARIPDGIGEWVDPIPTPGGVNEIGNEVPMEQKIIIDNESMSVISPENETVTENNDATNTVSEEPSVVEETAGLEIVVKTDPAIEPKTIVEIIVESVIVADHNLESEQETIVGTVVENAPDEGLIWTDAVEETPADVVAVLETLPVSDEVIL
jgi:hypothetical protein